MSVDSDGGSGGGGDIEQRAGGCNGTVATNGAG
jgi:hypothetical protein